MILTLISSAVDPTRLFSLLPRWLPENRVTWVVGHVFLRASDGLEGSCVRPSPSCISTGLPGTPVTLVTPQL